eukprot:g19084.t1
MTPLPRGGELQGPADVEGGKRKPGPEGETMKPKRRGLDTLIVHNIVSSIEETNYSARPRSQASRANGSRSGRPAPGQNKIVLADLQSFIEHWEEIRTTKWEIPAIERQKLLKLFPDNFHASTEDFERILEKGYEAVGGGGAGEAGAAVAGAGAEGRKTVGAGAGVAVGHGGGWGFLRASCSSCRRGRNTNTKSLSTSRTSEHQLSGAVDVGAEDESGDTTSSSSFPLQEHPSLHPSVVFFLRDGISYLERHETWLPANESGNPLVHWRAYVLYQTEDRPTFWERNEWIAHLVVILLLYFSVPLLFCTDLLPAETSICSDESGDGFRRAIYFASVTLMRCRDGPSRAIAAVGYGDVTPNSDAGKWFTVVFIMVGINVVANAVLRVMTTFLDVTGRAQEKNEDEEAVAESRTRTSSGFAAAFVNAGERLLGMAGLSSLPAGRGGTGGVAEGGSSPPQAATPPRTSAIAVSLSQAKVVHRISKLANHTVRPPKWLGAEEENDEHVGHLLPHKRNKTSSSDHSSSGAPPSKNTAAWPLATRLRDLVLGDTPFRRKLAWIKLTKAVQTLLLLLVPITLGSFLIHIAEGWGFTDCVYWSVVSLATVGYGELSHENAAFHWVWVFFLPLCCILYAFAYTNLLLTHRALQRERKKRKAMGERHLEQSLAILDRGQGIDLLEYMIANLVVTESVHPSDLSRIIDAFERLDFSGTGIVTREDVLRRGGGAGSRGGVLG